MAEVRVAIRNSGVELDGDIEEAYPNCVILNRHAQNICNPWGMDKIVNSDGYLDTTNITRDYLEVVSQYRFERISKNEVRRTVISTGDREIFADNWDLFLRRRRSSRCPNGSPKKPIFGSLGNEIWYGGSKDISNITMDLVWNDIESKTSYTKSDNMDLYWPDRILAHYLIVPMDDFSPIVRAEMIESEYGPNTDPGAGPEDTVIIKRRIRKIDYENDLQLSGRTIDDLRDRKKPVRKPRSITYNPSTVVKVRS